MRAITPTNLAKSLYNTVLLRIPMRIPPNIYSCPMLATSEGSITIFPLSCPGSGTPSRANPLVATSMSTSFRFFKSLEISSHTYLMSFLKRALTGKCLHRVGSVVNRCLNWSATKFIACITSSEINVNSVANED